MLRRGFSLVLVCLLASACMSSPPGPKPAAVPTPIGQLDTTTMTIPRSPFCHLLPAKAVRAALAGEVAESQEWGNGSDAPVGKKNADVSHEFGCSWANADGVVARAWVFARPLAHRDAQKVARAASTKEDCRTPKGPQFGNPAQLQICELGGGVLRIRHAGLFGDSWLSCEIAAPAAEPAQLRDRADRWCVDVATTLAAAKD